MHHILEEMKAVQVRIQKSVTRPAKLKAGTEETKENSRESSTHRTSKESDQEPNVTNRKRSTQPRHTNCPGNKSNKEGTTMTTERDTKNEQHPISKERETDPDPKNVRIEALSKIVKLQQTIEGRMKFYILFPCRARIFFIGINLSG